MCKFCISCYEAANFKCHIQMKSISHWFYKTNLERGFLGNILVGLYHKSSNSRVAGSGVGILKEVG